MGSRSTTCLIFPRMLQLQPLDTAAYVPANTSAKAPESGKSCDAYAIFFLDLPVFPATGGGKGLVRA